MWYCIISAGYDVAGGYFPLIVVIAVVLMVMMTSTIFPSCHGYDDISNIPRFPWL
jgi:hypothetical protein